MTQAITSIDVPAYRAEYEAHKGQPARDFPRRLLTEDGEPQAAMINGECRATWSRHDGAAHVAVTGAGSAHGVAVAACNRWAEVGDSCQDLIPAGRVALDKRCRRPGCRNLWPAYGARGGRRG